MPVVGINLIFVLWNLSGRKFYCLLNPHSLNSREKVKSCTMRVVRVGVKKVKSRIEKGIFGVGHSDKIHYVTSRSVNWTSVNWTSVNWTSVNWTSVNWMFIVFLYYFHCIIFRRSEDFELNFHHMF
jgi:hypothetical protein